MSKLKRVVGLALTTVGLGIAGRSPITPSPIVTPSPAPTATSTLQPTRVLITPSPTQRPEPWPLEVELAEVETKPSCKQLLQLKPGISSLQDVYDLLGYPLWRRDFSTGVVLGYPCEHIKFKHIVLVDGTSGDVLLVGAVVYGDEACPRFDDLQTQYGEPVMAIQHGRRKHWFFEGHDIADTEMVFQILPPGTTLEQYQSYNGYFEESYAFTP